MSKRLERAKELRDDPKIHYNCTQSVLIPFTEELGLGKELGMKMGANFGAGMRIGSVCGAITGGLMVLGLYGVEDATTCANYFKTLKSRHDGMMLCADLLKADRAKGNKVKKPHCDHMVYECIALVEEILKEKGIA